MKKSILLLVVLASSILSYGQGLFDKYEDIDGVTSGVLNQKMFSMLASINVNLDNPEDQAVFDAVKKIKNVKWLVTDKNLVSQQMRTDLKKHVTSAQLEELMRFKDGEQTVKFYVKEGENENHIKELLMFVDGLKELTDKENIKINGKKRTVETVVVSILGDIELKQISKVLNKMDIPGSEHLEKANENK